MRPLVYVAGPVTGDPWGCVRRATAMSSKLAGLGMDAYLPQLSVLHEMVDPQPYEFWVELGLSMVCRCDGLVRLSGESPGADREVEQAAALGVPVLSLPPGDVLRPPAEWVAGVHARYRWPIGAPADL